MSVLTLFAAILIVFVALWLGTRKRRGTGMRTAMGERAEVAAVPPREADAAISELLVTPPPAARAALPTSRAAPVPRLTIGADREISAASAPVRRARSARSSATSYMLRRRGLCSPDPHP